MYGTCTSAGTSTTTINVFVKPEHVETTGDGTYANPFGHIVKALSYANEQAADKGETSINIYLLGGGNHYMTKNIEHSMYAASKSNAYSYNQNIVIQPAFWGETLGGHTFGASDSNCIQSTEKITVYYKLGSYFSFIVPKSLTVKSILFDALDSAINPTEDCLKNNAVCCTISGTTISVNGANANPPSSCSVYSRQTEE